jgi:hypothetical protein
VLEDLLKNLLKAPLLKTLLPKTALSDSTQAAVKFREAQLAPRVWSRYAGRPQRCPFETIPEDELRRPVDGSDQANSPAAATTIGPGIVCFPLVRG